MTRKRHLVRLDRSALVLSACHPRSLLTRRVQAHITLAPLLCMESLNLFTYYSIPSSGNFDNRFAIPHLPERYIGIIGVVHGNLQVCDMMTVLLLLTGLIQVLVT